MLESLSFCGWMTQILIKILITVFLNSTIRLTAWLKTFLLKGASFYFARWLSKLVEGWHIFFVLVKMILIRLMASFTEVGLRYKLFFNPGTRKMLQGSKFSIHCMPLSKEYSLETREDNNSWRRRSGLTALTCDTTSQHFWFLHYLQFPSPARNSDDIYLDFVWMRGQLTNSTLRPAVGQPLARVAQRFRGQQIKVWWRQMIWRKLLEVRH